MTSALYNADTRCFSGRRVYSKIKNALSRQFAQHRVLPVIRRWIEVEVLAQLFLRNHFTNTWRAFLENHGLVVCAARLDMCCQREPPDGGEDEDRARTGSHQTGVSISPLFVKGQATALECWNNLRAESISAKAISFKARPANSDSIQIRDER